MPAPRKGLRPPRRQGARILVVEDHASCRRMLAAQLESLGHAADLAGDGAEALARAGERAYALVITDLDMPVMDGLQLARALRNLEAGVPGRPRLPIVALTANTSPDIRERCRAAGIDDVIGKPMALAELARCLTRWLPAAGGGAAAPVDLTVLLGMIGGDVQAAGALLEDFVRINVPLMEELGTACRDGALPQARSLAHKVLGSAHFAGARTLAQALAAIEDAARDGSVERAAALGPPAAAAFADVREWIAARGVRQEAPGRP